MANLAKNSVKVNSKIEKILTNTTFIDNKIKYFLIPVLMIFIMNIAIPQVTMAKPFLGEYNQKLVLKSTDTEFMTSRIEEAQEKYLPIKTTASKQPVSTTIGKEMYVMSSAYSSTVDQCDATPCITADGFNVCENGKENVLAANFLPIGTKVMIPELFGDRIFTVHDRMNKRYYYKVDIWMTSRDRAIQYGVRNIKIVIVD